MAYNGPIRVQITGIEELKAKLDRLQDELIDEALRRAVTKSAKNVLSIMKPFTPVDTRNLQDSEKIEYGRNGMEAFIGPDMAKAPYAPFVEYGFHHWISGKFIQGQHYIERTAVVTRPQIMSTFEDEIKRAVQAAMK